MKPYLFLFLLCLSFSVGNAQVLYVDPVTSAAMMSQSSTIEGQLKKTNNNLTLIERGQLAVTGQLLIVNDLQSAIFKGLSEVAGIVHSLSAISDIATTGLDIVDNLNTAVEIAKSDPVLLLFAEAGAREFKSRATKLALEVSQFVLKGGKDNLMDSGERARMLNHISQELHILSGSAFGIHRAMYWAKMRGIFKSLNPYSGWINMDMQIARDVILQAKYLKK